MHEIIYRMLGVERFALEWFDHRDQVEGSLSEFCWICVTFAQDVYYPPQR